MITQIILYISGDGSNARQIISYFKENQHIKVVGVLSSKANPKMVDFCSSHQLAFFDMSHRKFDEYLRISIELNAKWVVLAGFLKKIPAEIVAHFNERIINIHPSLLPKFGGPGMYGRRVHEAVSSSSELFSGISIHLVNNDYDKGRLLFQHAVPLAPGEKANQVEQKVRELEHLHFAKDLASYILPLLNHDPSSNN